MTRECQYVTRGGRVAQQDTDVGICWSVSTESSSLVWLRGSGKKYSTAELDSIRKEYYQACKWLTASPATGALEDIAIIDQQLTR